MKEPKIKILNIDSIEVKNEIDTNHDKPDNHHFKNLQRPKGWSILYQLNSRDGETKEHQLNFNFDYLLEHIYSLENRVSSLECEIDRLTQNIK